MNDLSMPVVHADNRAVDQTASNVLQRMLEDIEHPRRYTRADELRSQVVRFAATHAHRRHLWR